MKKLNAGEDIEFTSGQLRRALHTYIYTMPYVQSIAILTSSGRMVFDDLLTGFNTKISWLDTSTDRPARLFASIAASSGTMFFPTESASLYAVKRHNLFHLGHRFVEIRDIRRRSGVIILSIDERMLGEICDERLDKGPGAPTAGSICLLADDGTIVSHPDESLVGKKIDLPPAPALRDGAIKRIMSGGDAGNADRLSLYKLRESKTGWSIIAARDLGAVYRDISNQQRMTIVVILLTVAILLAIILFITDRLTRSIGTVVAAMNAASAGELSTRIKIGEDMPLEVEQIAENFNSMIGKIGDLLREVQSALTKQRDAEIAALEAQVNPHFLYNTLDTINWMAIDKDEFEISNAIGALADILRYGIDDSNGVVEIRREIEWLKKYVFLQQTRLKGAFRFHLDLDQSVLDLHIHKLLFQPFVENSIIHGFKGTGKERELSVSIGREGDLLAVTIADNGCGIEESVRREIEAGGSAESARKGHIGMRNAIERIEIYYAPLATVGVESSPGNGTRIRIELPVSELR
jgi:two-component system sensor histidine kinase YesM